MEKIKIELELVESMADLLIDTLLFSNDCGDDEYPYKSKELSEMVDIVVAAIKSAKKDTE